MRAMAQLLVAGQARANVRFGQPRAAASALREFEHCGTLVTNGLVTRR